MNCWGAFAVVKLEEYVEIASGDDFNCALNNDGIPTCWEMINGDKYPPKYVYDQVAVGDNHTCALTRSQPSSLLGRNLYGQSNAPVGLFTELSRRVPISIALLILKENFNVGVEMWTINQPLLLLLSPLFRFLVEISMLVRLQIMETCPAGEMIHMVNHLFQQV